MDLMSIPALSTIDQIIDEYNSKGKPIYIPVPKDLYLPYPMKMKDEFVYIPKRNVSVENLIEDALMSKSEGLRIIPPGLSLANLMEKKAKLSFSDANPSLLREVLPSIITQELELAEEFKINMKGNRVRTEVKNVVCEDLCREVSRMRHLCPYVGCPLSSSIACILTRISNKPVMIERCLLRNGVIETWYKILS